MGTAHSSPSLPPVPPPESLVPGHDSPPSAAAAAAAPDALASSGAAPPPGCPMHKGGASAAPMAAMAANARRVAPRGPVYNVYSQEIDPKNNMPAANQSPAPGQVTVLPTERVKSSIPKGGTEGHWLYPSPQMFYNSLVRKNKADGVEESDVSMVVSIHNEMNERTWGAMLEWEALHPRGSESDGPALRRFMGNPYKLSPKARLKSWLGHGFPFDRHDWYVDRGDEQIHYVIDYYFNPAGPANAPPPAGATGPAALQLTNSIYVDVRPAVESLGSLVDRLRRFPERALAALKRPRFAAEGIDPSLPHDDGGAAQRHASDSAPAIAAAAAAPAATAAAAAPRAAGSQAQWAAVDAKCGPLLEKLKAATTETERHSAHVAVNYCMGRVVCPNEAARFMTALDASSDDEERAFMAMTACVGAQLVVR